MKIIILLCLIIFSFDCNAQNTLVLETELRINKLLQKQKNIFFEDNLGNLKPLVKVNAFNSGLIIFLEKSDSLNSSMPSNLNLQLITQFKVEENKLLFANSKGEPLIKIIGFKKSDIRNLKKQFKKIKKISSFYQLKMEKDKVQVKKALLKKRDDLPDPKLNAKVINAEKEAIRILESKKSKN